VNNVLFSSIKCEKNLLKRKNQVRNEVFIDSYVFEYEGVGLSLWGKHIKDKCLH